MARPVETVVTRRLPEGFDIPYLNEMWHALNREGLELVRAFVSPSDFTSYGNLLTCAAGRTDLDSLEGGYSQLEFYGAEFERTPHWPTGTIGCLVKPCRAFRSYFPELF